MSRHDDDLQQITRDRLRTVAARPVRDAADGDRATTGAPWRVRSPADRRPSTPQDTPGGSRSVRATPPVSTPPDATSVPGIGRHRDTAPPTEPGVAAVVMPSRDGGATAGRAAGADAQDVLTRVRAEALAAASAAYGETHGHPLDRGAGRTPGPRWYLSLRHAVVAGAAVTVLAAGVVVRAVVAVPDDPQRLAASVTAGATMAGDRAGHAPAEAAGAGAGEPDASTSGAAGGAAGPAVPWGVAPTGGAGAPGAGPPTGPRLTGAASAGGGGPGTVAGVGPGPDAGRVVVHVVGQVGHPGVVELPAGSRVADALAVAGGATSGADLSAVNLARVVADGEQIVVPAPGEVVTPPPTGAATGGSSAGVVATDGSAPGPGAVLVDLNSAGPAELDGLPGIGPVLAQRILDWRAANGPFRHVEELGEVSGIGDALLGRLTPLVRV